MEHQPLLNENVKNDKPNMRRNLLVSLVVAVSVIGTGLVIADKAGYFTTVTTYNPSFRASDGLVSSDPTKKADMGGPMSSQLAPIAPGMEVVQGAAPVIAGTPSSGKSVPVPSSSTGTEVAKQAGVAKSTTINGGVAIDYITKTDGGKGPQPSDVTVPSWVDLDAPSSVKTLIAPLKGAKISTTTTTTAPVTKTTTTDKSASTKSATTKDTSVSKSSSSKDSSKSTTADVSTKATKTSKSAGEHNLSQS